jgi:hypothetical protein
MKYKFYAETTEDVMQKGLDIKNAYPDGQVSITELGNPLKDKTRKVNVEVSFETENKQFADYVSTSTDKIKTDFNLSVFEVKNG